MLKDGKLHDFKINKHKVYSLLLITIGFSISISLLSAQTIYKWVDENGSVNYGGTPPAGITRINTLSVYNAPNSEDPKSSPPNEHKTTNNKKGEKFKQSKNSTQNPNRKCAFYKKKLSYYISRMRAGYVAKQYNHLEQKRRKYRRKVLQSCREGVITQSNSKKP